MEDRAVRACGEGPGRAPEEEEEARAVCRVCRGRVQGRGAAPHCPCLCGGPRHLQSRGGWAEACRTRASNEKWMSRAQRAGTPALGRASAQPEGAL